MSYAAVFPSLIEHATQPQLPSIVANIWHAWGEGKLSDAEANTFALAADQRLDRRAKATMKVGVSATRSSRFMTTIKRAVDRVSAIEALARNEPSRRHRRAFRGRIPADIAEPLRLTPALAAVLDVIAVELQHHGYCDWPVAKIAALADCCENTVRKAIQVARAYGLIKVTERQFSRLRNLTNLIQLATDKLGQLWRKWLAKMGRGGGCKLVKGRGYNEQQEGLPRQDRAGWTVGATTTDASQSPRAARRRR